MKVHRDGVQAVVMSCRLFSLPVKLSVTFFSLLHKYRQTEVSVLILPRSFSTVKSARHFWQSTGGT